MPKPQSDGQERNVEREDSESVGIGFYAQNLAGSMKINPHLLVVGDERTTQHSRHNIDKAGGDQDEQESCPQKIFEISPSGFMTEQDLAATGAASNSALLLMDLKRTLDASESAKTSKGEGFDPFTEVVGMGMVDPARRLSAERQRRFTRSFALCVPPTPTSTGKCECISFPRRRRITVASCPSRSDRRASSACH